MWARHKILVVDHDRIALHKVERLLNEMGVEPRCLSNSWQAAELVRHEKFDGVLLEWNLPGLDGRGLAHRIRISPSNSRVPVTLATCWNFPHAVAEGHSLGITFFLAKPFGAAGLRRWLNVSRAAMLAERRRYQRSPLEVPVTCGWEGYRVSGRTLNISAGGLLMELKDCPEPGGPVWLDFALPETRVSWRVEALIARAGSGHRVAAKFVGLSADQNSLLMAYTDRILKVPLEPFRQKWVKPEPNAAPEPKSAPAPQTVQTARAPQPDSTAGPSARRAGDTTRIRSSTRRRKTAAVTKPLSPPRAALKAKTVKPSAHKGSSPRKVSPQSNASKAKAPPVKLRRSRGGVRVLLLDESRARRHAMTSILEGKGWTIQEAASTAEGLKQLQASKWDLVVADVSTIHPHSPLFEVLEELAKTDGPVQVLFSLQAGKEEQVQQQLEKLGLRCVNKPLHFGGFLDQVSDLLFDSGAIVRPLRQVGNIAPRAVAPSRSGSGFDLGRRDQGMFYSRDEYFDYDYEYEEAPKKTKEKNPAFEEETTFL